MAFKKEKNGFYFGQNFISEYIYNWGSLDNVYLAKINASFLLTDIYNDCMLMMVRNPIDYCSMISL